MVDTGQLLKTFEVDAQKILAHMHDAFKRVRTVRANIAMLDHIRVQYYGQMMPVHQVASLTIEGSSSIIVTPWEKSMTHLIEKAILKSDIGVTPLVVGSVIKISLPSLTSERRQQLDGQINVITESAKISIRHVRRDVNAKIKQMNKDKILSDDDKKVIEDQIQDITNQYILKIDEGADFKHKALHINENIS